MKMYLGIMVGAVSLASLAPAQDITLQEREHALQYLSETRGGLLDAVKGLSDAQWKFKPAADRWSVAEVVEHVAVIEGLVMGNLAKLDEAPAPTADREYKQTDAMILAMVPDRTHKVQSPEVALPAGRWTHEAALDHFLASRKLMIGLLESRTDLRGHLVNHPALGPLDGYQWILATAAHSARHTKQILEVKADPNFPAN